MHTKSDYINFLENLKGRDRIGVLSEWLSTSAGVASGVVASGSIASAAGASTILGSSTLGSLLSGVFVASTPIGWVIGSAVAAGTIGWCISKGAYTGGKSDEIRKNWKKSTKRKINKAMVSSASTIEELLTDGVFKNQYFQFIDSLKIAVTQDKISQKKSDELIGLVESGHMKLEIAIRRINGIIVGT